MQDTRRYTISRGLSQNFGYTPITQVYSQEFRLFEKGVLSFFSRVPQRFFDVIAVGKLKSLGQRRVAVSAV